MEKELRIRKLKQIKATQKSYMTGIRIMYGRTSKSFNAYKIPLDCLIYNKYNGRIGSRIKSYEKQFHTIDSENPEHVAKIEKFLWESKKLRNKGTMYDIVKKGQQKHGIVTNDGRIIDGNRRALLLNRIWGEREAWRKDKNDVDHCQCFIAVILDEDMDRKELMRLETTWQMGEDEKLDYGPIEKYLKCKDLKAEGFEDMDIAEMMTEKKATIQKWLRIMNLMDDYLDYFGYTGIYTNLDEREDLFINLCEDLERLRKRGARNADWEYKETDIVDLKTVCFDYIRTKFEGKEFRNICSAKGSFFSNVSIWKDFRDKHYKDVTKVKERPIEEIRRENQGVDLSSLFQARDDDWKKNVTGDFNGNFGRSKGRLEAFKEANEPARLLQKVVDILESVNTEVKAFYEDLAVKMLLGDINRTTYKYKQLIEKHNKHNR